MSTRTPSPRIRLLAIVGLVAGLFGASIATPAFAHDELLGSDPAPDAQVAELPAELTLTFSGVLIDEPGANRMSVTDAAGTELADGDPVLDGVEVTQPLSGDSQGTITVQWRVVSSDGHPISGEYTFVAGDPSAAPTPGAESTAGEPAGSDDAADTGLSPALWIGGGIAVLAAIVGVAIAVSAASRRRTED